MNRTQRIDSEKSLDDGMRTRHSAAMAKHMFNLHCRRIDTAARMQRFYILSLHTTLFGDIAVTRCWGRIGCCGSEKTDLFCSEQDAVRHFLELAMVKRRKGYRPVPGLWSVKGNLRH